MPGYTTMPGRETSQSPGSGDSAIVADSSASPELQHEIDFADETGEETFTSFGENHGAEYESDMTDLNSQSPETDNRGLVRRNSWLRTSLRRTSPNTDSLVPPKRWGSFRTPRQPRSTAALASALYNSGPATSGSFNSSGRSSNCDDGDIHSDISIEEDVHELNSKVRQLQDQVSILSENQAANDERYSRVKADNVTLTAKIHVLEENIREIEMRGEERLVEEQRRNRDMIQRLEREKQLEIENYTIRLQGLEKDQRLLSEEVNSLRSQLEKARMEKMNVEEQLTETQMMLQQEQRDHKILAQSRAREMEQWTDEREKSLHVVEEMTREVEQLKSQKAELTRKNSSLSSANGDGDDVFGDLPARIAEAEAEIRVLREQNKRYKESTEELQAALVSKSLEEGRTLLNNTNDRSLAAEFDAMSENETPEHLAAELNKMRKALQDQQDVNLHLRKYIDSVLLNIMEKYPELLEVRGK